MQGRAAWRLAALALLALILYLCGACLARQAELPRGLVAWSCAGCR